MEVEIPPQFKLNGHRYSNEELKEVAYSLIKEGEDFEKHHKQGSKQRHTFQTYGQVVKVRGQRLKRYVLYWQPELWLYFFPVLKSTRGGFSRPKKNILFSLSWMLRIPFLVASLSPITSTIHGPSGRRTETGNSPTHLPHTTTS